MHRASIFLCSIFAILLENNAVFGKALVRYKRANDFYTTKYDNIDVDAILASNRLVKNYINCLLEKGPCSPEGKTLKTYLPDALATECKKCSPAQKKIAGKVLSHLLLNHRPDFIKLADKYDPDGRFRKQYLDEDEDYSDLDGA